MSIFKYLYRILVLLTCMAFVISLGGVMSSFFSGDMKYIQKFFFYQEKLFKYCVIVFCIGLALDIVTKNFTRVVGLMDEHSLRNFRNSLMYAGFGSILVLLMYSIAYGVPSTKLLFWIPFSAFLHVFAVVEQLRGLFIEDIEKYWDKPDEVKENAIKLSQQAHESKRKRE